MKNISRRYIGGFTLVELLVVVLIIGILSAVAIPMYQGAVDKSNFSTMLAPTRSLKEAQEGVRMATGNYTDNAEDLDVALSQESLSYEFQTRDNGDEFNAIIATNPKLPNVRLARYLDENLLLAGQLHCQAKAGDERANRLCGPLLIGQELKAIDGYISYLLDEEIDQPTCDYAGKSYSTSKTKCYKDDETRCSALGMEVQSAGQCGYTDAKNQTVGEEGICKAEKKGGCSNTTVANGGKCVAESQNGCNNSSFDGENTGCESVGSFDNCRNSTYTNGAQCVASATGEFGCMDSSYTSGATCTAEGRDGCRNSTFSEGATCIAGSDGSCSVSKFNEGGICQADSKYGCERSTFNEGSKCIANAPNTCCVNGCGWRGVTYNGGCCEGPYCPDDVPKC